MSTAETNPEERARPVPAPNHDLITVNSYTNTNDANMARLKLESADIPVFLDNEFFATTHPFAGIAAGGIKVKVARADAQEALAILGAGTLVQCPQCQSVAVMHIPLPFRKLLLAFLLLTIPLWLPRPHWHCTDCGHEW